MARMMSSPLPAGKSPFIYYLLFAVYDLAILAPAEGQLSACISVPPRPLN